MRQRDRQAPQSARLGQCQQGLAVLRIYVVCTGLKLGPADGQDPSLFSSEGHSLAQPPLSLPNSFFETGRRGRR